VTGEHGCHGPDHLDDLGAGLPEWGETSTVCKMFALLARLTGVVFTPDWLDGQFWTMPVTEHYT
jgi:hypothetical protein